MKISYLVITARTDFPTMGLPDLHLWEPTLLTLARQTFTDFEFIIIDVLYNERPDYFKEHNYGLRIKHIPAAPNPWSELGLVQTCSQFNRGMIHADGELIFTDADSSLLPPDLMANLWQHYKDGCFVSLGFGADVTFAPELYDTPGNVQGNGTYRVKEGELQGAKLADAKKTMIPTDWYRSIDALSRYQGLVIMDHRYRQVFSDPNTRRIQISPDWYYGISTVSMEAAIKVNGYNVSFDGDSALNDVDMGWRLAMAGYSSFALCRDCYIVEAYAKLGWNPKMRDGVKGATRPEVKCNNALLLLSRERKRFRANTPLSASDIDYMINDICRTKCGVRDTCKTLPHRGPFYNKNEPALYAHWLKHGATFSMDLEIERELRQSGDAYTEGTFINCS